MHGQTPPPAFDPKDPWLAGLVAPIELVCPCTDGCENCDEED